MLYVNMKIQSKNYLYKKNRSPKKKENPTKVINFFFFNCWETDMVSYILHGTLHWRRFFAPPPPLKVKSVKSSPSKWFRKIFLTHCVHRTGVDKKWKLELSPNVQTLKIQYNRTWSSLANEMHPCRSGRLLMSPRVKVILARLLLSLS